MPHPPVSPGPPGPSEPTPTPGIRSFVTVQPVRLRRIAAAIALAAVVAAGLVVHRVLPGSTGADVAGDALYTAAVYAGLVLVTACRPIAAGITAAAWSVAVELFQATGIPSALAAAFPPMALVLGTAFDARDLVVYVFAALVATALDTAVLIALGAGHRRQSTSGGRP